MVLLQRRVGDYGLRVILIFEGMDAAGKGGAIRDFELMLAEEQYLLLKFWIQVSRDEQFKRSKRRLDNPYKSWKLTPEDWRNRQKYDEYLEHARVMIETTHAPYAPWYVIAGNDKLLARVSVLRITTDALHGYPVDTSPYSHSFEQLHWLEEHGEEPLDN